MSTLAGTTDKEKGKVGRSSTACVECQRRKQRCNREWPCNNCHARRVPDLCQFLPKKPDPNKKSESPPGQVDATLSSKKRKETDTDEQVSQADLETHDVNDTLETMGLTSSEENHNLTWTVLRNTVAAPGNEPAVRNKDIDSALQAMLPRSYTDSLIQNFLNGGNFYYYIVYPALFSEQYRQWWQDRMDDKPLSPELTCLILRLCACSALFPTPDIRAAIETELGEKPIALSQRLQATAEKLSATIPPGRGGVVQVQQVFLSAFWYKVEARWTESWHALATAIHKAQEIGLHRDSRSVGMSEFDRDVRRRMWCLLYVWDWQSSLLFDRPLIINHANCSFELPALKVDQSPVDDDAPSPYAHMRMQCQLIRSISDKFGVIESPLPLQTALALQQYIQDWVADFPAVYAIKNTDTSRDAEYYFLTLQRPYLHAISYAMIFTPLKPFIVKSLDPNKASDEEKRARSLGVDVAIQFMDIAKILFDQVYPNDAKFHFSFFALFDVSALLCSAIMHDKHGTLPRRGEIAEYIKRALDMLKQLVEVTDTAAMAFKVLLRLVTSLDLTPVEKAVLGISQAKRVKKSAVAETSLETLKAGVVVNNVELSLSPALDSLDVNDVSTLGSQGSGSAESLGSVGAVNGLPEVHEVSSFNGGDVDYSAPPFDLSFDPFLDMPLIEPAGVAEFGDIAGMNPEELGILGEIWNYDLLDLPFNTPPPESGF